ncbi:MAG: DUF4437 domain-containing protein [Planctomycetota bacterium]
MKSISTFNTLRYTALTVAAVALPVGFAAADAPVEAAAPAVVSTIEVLPASDVNWTPLNPARGDASPQAADLWGDRSVDGATGFLVKFKDGFSSPPHIHNVTYRGVVISGLVHNDDPDAEPMWMPAGSFWTQPAGESHITSAKGDENVAYIEIQAGPYLVQPADEAFDNGERPVNVSAANLVWLGAEELSRIDDGTGEDGAEIAFLWGDPSGDQPSGAMVKLPAGFAGVLQGNASWLRAVVVRGTVTHATAPDAGTHSLAPGSYFGAEGGTSHHLSADTDTLLYVRTSGRFELMAHSASE